MKSDSGQTTSLWMATAADIPADSLSDERTHADVCVVGAGIAGMTTAYLLGCEGLRVIVLDDGPVAGGMTARTTAHLTSVLDDGFVEIERMHGEDDARLAAGSHAAAIDQIEAIVAAEDIDCEFERVDGYLFAPPEHSPALLRDEREAAVRAGLDVELIARAPLPDFDTGQCLRFPMQAQFHPLRYIAGLARAIQRDGGRIVTGVHAISIEGGEHARIETGGHRIVLADAVVVATNTPVNDRVAIHTKQAPYITYAIGARVPTGSVPRALYWDTADPYHYVRLAGEEGGDGSHEILIVGGEDHKTGQDDGSDRFGRLEAWARVRFPTIESVPFRWSGQVMEPVDGLAFIGRNPLDHPNVYIASGDSGQGITHGTIAGILLTDLLMGKENPWTRLYDPTRITLQALGEFAAENLNVAAQYADLATSGDVQSTDEVQPGEGAVMRRGLKKYAIYRAEAGVVHERSAVCPHLGCVVRWNGTEKSWDCPCHGSRFDAFGRVFQGPANSDLAE